jgi:hypothetical protein
MPPSRPASLEDDVYADITAYILSVNGVPATGTALPADPAAMGDMTIPR